MIIDGLRIPDNAVVETDICIVGSGPAGMTLARRLSELSSKRIAVIESGSLDQNDAAQELATGEVEGQPYFPLHETRVRRVGGSSWSWGGVLCPLDPLDFERRGWVAHSGWPIPHHAITEHYPAARAILGADGSDDAPSDAPGGPVTDEIEPGTVYFTRPMRFGRDYAASFRDDDRAHIYTNTSAISLEPDCDGNLIEGVEVGCLTGTRWRVSARTVVLAGGGIENARLLMLTNLRHGTRLGESGGHLGRFFMEHPRLVDRLWIEGDMSPLGELVTTRVDMRRFGRLNLTPETQQREQLLNYHVNLAFGYAGQDGPGWAAVRRLALAMRKPWCESPFFQDAGGGPMGVHWADMRAALAHPINSATSALGASVRPAWLRRFVNIASSVEQAPDPNNRITLGSGGRDAFGLPKTKLYWTLGEAERRTYERGLELVVGYLSRMLPPTARVVRLERARWEQDLLGTWHHIGTTRMGNSPADSVVDKDLRVHGVGNLYAAGSSVFPTGGVSAPTLSIVALSLRLAAHLADAARWRQPSAIVTDRPRVLADGRAHHVAPAP